MSSKSNEIYPAVPPGGIQVNQFEAHVITKPFQRGKFKFIESQYYAGEAMMHREKYSALLAVAVIIIFLSSISMVGAATILVSSGQSIQAAINGANPGDTISVQSGVYRECLNITKPVFLVGQGRPLLDGGAMGSAIVLRFDGTSIIGFDIRTTRQTGIHVLSENNILENNTISGCLDGIRLDHSQANFIAHNDINNNTNGITVYASEQNTIANNNIRDNNINEESDCGIFLAYSRDNIISGNNMMENGDSSISLRSASNNTLRGNIVAENDWYGISLSESSNNNLIEKNSAVRNKDAGIYLDSSRENLIRDNTASDSAKGIYLSFDSNENILTGNSISYNGKGLLLAGHSSNNTLQNNTARENGYGIYLSFSSGWNLLFSNHLIDNGCNAYDMGKSNRWDNGQAGNYYSDLGQVFYIPGGPGVDKHPMAEPGV
jgi:parallel beta-helix repeat protein